MDEPNCPDSAESAPAPMNGLPPLAAVRARQAIWWWRGAGIGFLALAAITIVFDIGGDAPLAVDVVLWLVASVVLGGICFAQIRCAGDFVRRGLIAGWLAGLWIAAVAAVPLLLIATILFAGGQLDHAAFGPVSWAALFYLSISAGLLVLVAVDASVAARTGTPLLSLRHRPLVMGVLLYGLWSLEFAGLVGFNSAQIYSFIVVLLAPWLLHLREPAEDAEPGVTPRSAAA